MNTQQVRMINLPVKGNYWLIYAFSFLIAILTAIASITGLQNRALIYPTDELIRAFVPNDVVNLVIGLPTLLGSMWLTWRGTLIGLLCWMGALFFVFYNSIAYIFALPLNWTFLIHLTLVMLSMYTLVDLLVSIDGKAVQQRLAGDVPEKFCGGVLAGLGLLFLLRVFVVIVDALIRGTPLTETELAVNVSDFLITPAWVVGGVLLWRRQEFGYMTGLGLLLQGSMLFIALIVFLLLRPFLTTAPFVMADVVVIFAMALICFIPFGLFFRGVLADDKYHPNRS